jgi:hypothetical protein
MWRSAGGICAEGLTAEVQGASPKPPQSTPLRTFAPDFYTPNPLCALIPPAGAKCLSFCSGAGQLIASSLDRVHTRVAEWTVFAR